MPKEVQSSVETKKVLLIDGYSLIFRAFYALPPDLRSADGQPTQAVLGFLNMLVRLLAEQEPTHLAVALDAPGPTFRHEAYPEYKGHREKTPAELKSQFPLVREVLAALRIPVVEAAGYEADDVIGTLARLASETEGGGQVVIVSGDRDLLQLVSDSVTALITRRGISDLQAYDLERIKTEYEVEPRQLADVKGLMGDPSDNIPGVPGVGEKTALRLIRQFGDVDAVLANLDQVGGKKLPATLAEYSEVAKQSRDLATIVRNVALPQTDVQALQRQEPHREETVAILDRLGFRSLMARLGFDQQEEALAAGRQQLQAAQAPVHRRELPADDWDDLQTALATAEKAALLYRCHNPEPNFRHDAVAVLAVHLEGKGTWVLSTAADDDEGELLAVVEQLADRVRQGKLQLTGHDLKLLLGRFNRHLHRNGTPLAAPASESLSPLFSGADLDDTDADAGQGALFDTAVAAYLLDPSRTNYRVTELARQYLERELADPADLLPTGRRRAGEAPRGYRSVDGKALSGVLAAMAAALPALQEALAVELAHRDLTGLFTAVEMPLLLVLASMEHRGVRVEEEVLAEIGEIINERLDGLADQIHALAGSSFNINSPQQLGKVLFEDLGLPVIKRTKTGYSTDAGVLEALASKHDIVPLVTEYRQLAKLRGTYVEGLRAEVNPADQRIHTTFQQTGTATGRLASTAPNLQNIPVRDEFGRELRRAFSASPGHQLVTADYSQIELRILAHLSGDEGLQAAFARGEDIHRRTAAEVFGTAPEDVTGEQRSAAKAVNFGIIYGISDFGLSQQLGTTREKAKAYIDAYFSRYKQVEQFIQQQIRQAEQSGYVQTLFHRLRYLPDINHRVAHRRQFAQRTAVNTPIQGTAADIIKLAMVKVEERLQSEGLAGRLVLQIHDELMVEVPAAEVPAAAAILTDVMTNCVQLSVPLAVEVKVGPNWHQLQPFSQVVR